MSDHIERIALPVKGDGEDVLDPTLDEGTLDAAVAVGCRKAEDALAALPKTGAQSCVAMFNVAEQRLSGFYTASERCTNVLWKSTASQEDSSHGPTALLNAAPVHTQLRFERVPQPPALRAVMMHGCYIPCQ